MVSTSPNTLPQTTTGRCHVIPVHGTFAGRDGATQWQICDDLQKVGAVIHPDFKWSGNNNHPSRIAAGKELAAYIDSLKIPPSDCLFLVAHSHGGNVALYALKHTGTERVEGIVFLATPFLLFRPHNFAFVGITMSPYAIAMIAFTLFASLFATLVGVTLKPHHFEATFAKWVGAIISLGLASVPAIYAYRAFRVLLQKTDAPQDEIYELCKQYQPPIPDGRRVIIIRKTSDEITLFLDSGHLIEALLTLVWRSLSWLERRTRIVWNAIGTFVEKYLLAKLILLLLVSGYLWLFYFNPKLAVPPSVWVFGSVVAASFLLILLQVFFLELILFLNILRFGQQPARGYTAHIRVTSEATPVGAWQVETVPATGFAHSEIHEDPYVAKTIVKWLHLEGGQEHRETDA